MQERERREKTTKKEEEKEHIYNVMMRELKKTIKIF